MVDEIIYTMTARFAKGAIDVNFGVTNKKLTVTGTKFTQSVQTVSVTRELLVLNEVATPHFLVIQNLDATYNILVYPDATDDALVKVKPLQWSAFGLASATPYVGSNAGTPKFEYLVIED